MRATTRELCEAVEEAVVRCSVHVARMREECDHLLHIVRAINDKSDGFLDELLPYAILEVNETLACVAHESIRPS